MTAEIWKTIDGPERYGRHHYGRSATFASTLAAPSSSQPDNWTLRITLRLQLMRGQPTSPSHGVGTTRDANGSRPFVVREWRTREWQVFTNRYRFHTQRFWNGKFWLDTPDDYDGLNWPPNRPTHRPNVWCDFQIQLVDDAAVAHQRIMVYYVLGPDPSRFRSSSRRQDQYDIIPVSGRYSAPHEMGHLLGIAHSGRGLPGCRAGNEDICYAVTGEDAPVRWPWLRQNVMGGGMLLDPSLALPWRSRITRHTGTLFEDWEPRMGPRPNRRAYPRSLSG
jgi:hypothetical protein